MSCLQPAFPNCKLVTIGCPHNCLKMFLNNTFFIFHTYYYSRGGGLAQKHEKSTFFETLPKRFFLLFLENFGIFNYIFSAQFLHLLLSPPSSLLIHRNTNPPINLLRVGWGPFTQLFPEVWKFPNILTASVSFHSLIIKLPLIIIIIYLRYQRSCFTVEQKFN